MALEIFAVQNDKGQWLHRYGFSDEFVNARIYARSGTARSLATRYKSQHAKPVVLIVNEVQDLPLKRR